MRGFQLTLNVTFDNGLPELKAVFGLNDVATKDLVLVKITSEDINRRKPNVMDITVNTMLAFIDLTCDFSI